MDFDTATLTRIACESKVTYLVRFDSDRLVGGRTEIVVFAWLDVITAPVLRPFEGETGPDGRKRRTGTIPGVAPLSRDRALSTAPQIRDSFRYCGESPSNAVVSFPLMKEMRPDDRYSPSGFRCQIASTPIHSSAEGVQ